MRAIARSSSALQRDMRCCDQYIVIPLAFLAIAVAEVAAFAWGNVMFPIVAPAMLLVGLSSFVAVLA